MAETNSLLNCRTGNCTGGSNPPFSAKPTKDRICAVFFLQIGEDGKLACQAYRFVKKMRTLLSVSLPVLSKVPAAACGDYAEIPLSPQSVESGNTRRRQTINESFGSHFFLQYKVCCESLFS